MSAHPPAHHHPDHAHPDAAARVDAVLEQLRADGGRVTAGRRAIVVALFTGPDHHVTADDLAAAVQPAHPELHLSTIYRTLDALERLDVVTRVDLGSGAAVYHLVDHVHHHLVCEVCGSVTEIPDVLIEPLSTTLDERFGFAASPYHLTITGRCRPCRATEG